MRVTKTQLGPIMNQGLTEVIIPGGLGEPEGRQRLHRRGGPVVCWVEITTVRLVVAIDEHVTPVDARRNGYQRLGDYRDDWCRSHDAPWTGSPGWLVGFTIVPARERVHLLANQDGKRSPAQYTARSDQALPQEPEAVPHAVVTGLRTTMINGQRHAVDLAELAAEEFTGTIGERLDRALEEARRNGVDPSPIERLAARKVQQLEERARRAA